MNKRNHKTNGQFKKGHKTNIGRKHSRETIEKMQNRRRNWKIKDTSNMSHSAWNKGKKGIMPEPWNKGLTKETDDRVMKQSLIVKENRKYQVFPKKDSSIEIKIQNFLKQLGIEFFTHQYMNINHAYQCDILIPCMNLVIECDGDYWHKYPVGLEKDHIRTKELIKKGFKVLRLWEFEIKTMDLNKFKEKLYEKR